MTNFEYFDDVDGKRFVQLVCTLQHVAIVVHVARKLRGDQGQFTASGFGIDRPDKTMDIISWKQYALLRAQVAWEQGD